MAGGAIEKSETGLGGPQAEPRFCSSECLTPLLPPPGMCVSASEENDETQLSSFLKSGVISFTSFRLSWVFIDARRLFSSWGEQGLLWLWCVGLIAARVPRVTEQGL